MESAGSTVAKDCVTAITQYAPNMWIYCATDILDSSFGLWLDPSYDSCFAIFRPADFLSELNLALTKKLGIEIYYRDFSYVTYAQRWRRYDRSERWAEEPAA
jgi:hypothetical protein